MHKLRNISILNLIIFLLLINVLYQFEYADIPKSPLVYKWPYILPTNFNNKLMSLNLRRYIPKERDYITGRLPLLVERALNVSKVCSKKEERIETKGWSNFIWDTHHQPNLVYCPMTKVGSTTMMFYFLIGADFEMEKNKNGNRREKKSKFSNWKHTTAHEVFRMPKDLEERVNIFQKSLKMVVVRHPFARLISGYKFHFLQVRKGDKTYTSLKRHIIHKYRTNGRDTSDQVAFKELVAYIIDHKEFIKEFDAENVDRLYMLQSRLCDVCLMDPSMIFKLETLNEDVKFMAYLANIGQLKEEIVFPKSVAHSTAHGKTNEYFEEITEQEIKELYKIYEDDFLMFGYTLEEYFTK